MRITILGRSGSGKSTYAVNLGRRLYLPVHHLDKHFFIHSWIKRNAHEFLAIQKQLVAQDKWIIDGNSLGTLTTRLERTDLVIIFDMPKLLCLWRIIKRAFQTNRNIDDRAPNSPEQVTWKLIGYSWNYEKRLAQKAAILLDNAAEKIPVIYVRSGQDLHKLDQRIDDMVITLNKRGTLKPNVDSNN